jgi:hypothetical protein
MIGSDLDGADLQSRVASWAASAASGDAAAVRAVIEVLWRPADGGRCGRRRQPVHQQRRRHAARARNRRRESAAYCHIRRHFRERTPGLYVPIRRHRRQRRPRGSQGNKPGGRSRSVLPTTRDQRVSGSCSFWNARRPLEDQRSTCTSSCRSSQEGAAPAPSESVTRIRARSAFACVAQHDAVPAVTLIYLPVQGPCR